MFRTHEKFIAFCLLGGALVGLAVMVYLKPPSSAVLENGAGMAMLNTIVGALTLAFGGAANALFKITSAERAEIGQAAADAIQSGEPILTEITNKPEHPVPTTESSTPDAGLPEGVR